MTYPEWEKIHEADKAYRRKLEREREEENAKPSIKRVLRSILTAISCTGVRNVR